MLEELGYRVTATENGRIALHLLSRNSLFDPLLANVAMLRLSGVEIMHVTRESGSAPRVLYAASYVDLGAYRPGLPGEGMIRKPCRMADLAARVDCALRAPPRCRRAGGGPVGRPATAAGPQ